MTEAFGKDWIKHNIPGELAESWRAKREKGLATGEKSVFLIDYADFTDYVRIIDRNDNWEAVFKSIFRRKESVRESFQRLYPIRLCTMHSRFVAHEDELYLLVETNRILASIADS